MRLKFVDKVSKPVLTQLLDMLLQDKVLNDEERESICEEKSRADMARSLIDTVRKKGSTASKMMINHFEQKDPILFSELGLSCPEPAQTSRNSKHVSSKRNPSE